MILLIHNTVLVVEVLDLNNNVSVSFSNSNPIDELFSLAKKHEDSILVWCHEDQKDNLNFEGISESFHLKNIMMSYSYKTYLPEQIGYIEDSPFLKINKTVKYPTWLMSSQVGAIHAAQLFKFRRLIPAKTNFDYALNSIAKLGISKGLFCYSEPNLLKELPIGEYKNRASISTLFKFVKQHYKTRWVLLLFLDFFWHDKKIPIVSVVKSLFCKNKSIDTVFNTATEGTNNIAKTIDVIIPSIGRKTFLYDVLKDLSVQKLLPTKVIIIEQNPDTKSKTELDFVEKKSWPFKIEHQLINKTGACNARNMALNKVESSYVFFADDDIRLNENTLQSAINCMHSNKFNAITLSCLNPNDIEVYGHYFQWASFGSGCSVVKKESLYDCLFNMAFEFGYGEDIDFGMQLRNKGVDIFYVPNIRLIHLRAPIGGFRTKFVHPWENDEIQPKPFPTVMLHRILNTTKHQLLGYKTILFFKFYKHQEIKNPFIYYKKFKKQWQQSVYWANKLKENNQ